MWTEVYMSACADRGVDPRPEVLAAEATSSLTLNGNTFARFHHRLRDTELGAMAALFTRLPTLTALHLPYNHLTSAGAAAIAEAMAHGFSSLQLLDLSHNAIDADGAGRIAAAAATHRALSALRLAGNPIGGDWARSAMAMLAGDAPLRQLDVARTDQPLGALVLLAGGARRCASLAVLDLSRPLLRGPEEVRAAVRHVCLGLRGHAAWRVLDLRHADLTDTDAGVLLAAVAESAVTALGLRGNRLSQDAGGAVAELMRRRGDMEAIDLSANRLRDAGAVSIAEAVATHEGIRALGLSHNTMGGVGITAVAKAVGANTSLRALQLWGNDFSEASATALYEVREKLEAMEEIDFGIYVVDGQAMISRA